jgi:16S rRNA processing protein RimM
MPPAATQSPQPDRQLVCVGEIAAPHGVRGLVRVRSFTLEPDALTAYGPPTDAAGQRRFDLTLLSPHRGQWLARIDGVEDRDAAAALRGTRLYVDREALPPPEEDEFYHADLIGLRAQKPDGTPLGMVRAVHDFGAGDVLEIVPPPGSGGAGTLTVPFTERVVPTVDVAGGRVVVEPPEGLLTDPSAGEGGEQEESGDNAPDGETGDEVGDRRAAG